MIEYKYVKARMKSKVIKLLKKYSEDGWKLKSVAMGDLATRFEMIFERDSDKSYRYEYVYKRSRMAGKVTAYLNEFSQKGYNMVFHVMGDMATRHELFFEKQIS